MAWKTVFAAGLETAIGRKETDRTSGSDAGAQTVAKTGVYSVDYGASTFGLFATFPTIGVSCRMGYWINMQTRVGNSDSIYFQFWDENDDTVSEVRDSSVNGDLLLKMVTESSGTLDYRHQYQTPLFRGVTWNHVALECGPGFSTFYINGIPYLTTDTNISTKAVHMARATASNNRNLHDDFYIQTSDVSMGTPTDPPPAYRFFPIFVQRSVLEEFENSKSIFIDSKELVDDIPNDGDESYIFATNPDTKEQLYLFSSPQPPLPYAHKPEGVGIWAIARKYSNDATLSFLQNDGTNQDEEASYPIEDLFDYRVYSAVFDSAPDNSDWTEEKISDTSFGVKASFI